MSIAKPKSDLLTAKPHTHLPTQAKLITAGNKSQVNRLSNKVAHTELSNTLVKNGLVYRARENQIPNVFRFCLRLESGFLLVFGTGLISELPNPAAGENCLHFSILDRKTELL